MTNAEHQIMDMPNPAPAAPFVNLEHAFDDAPNVTEMRHGDAFGATLAWIGRTLGTSQIGIALTRTMPGKAAWPRHFHHVNEEVIIVLSGAGTLRYGDGRQPLKPGDVVRIAPGTGIPFHVVNDGEDELRYLVLSGLSGTDVFEYPDSGKIGLVTGGGGPLRGPHAREVFLPISAGVPYWTGE